LLSLLSLPAILSALSGCREKTDPPPVAPRREPVARPLDARAEARALADLPDVDLWYAVQASGQHVGARHVVLRAIPTEKTNSKANSKAKTEAKKATASATAADKSAAARASDRPRLPAPLRHRPHVLLRIDQRIRLRAGGHETVRRHTLVERCAADGTLLSLQYVSQRGPDADDLDDPDDPNDPNDPNDPGAKTARGQARRYLRHHGALRDLATGQRVARPAAAKGPIRGRCALWLTFLRREAQAGGRSPRGRSAMATHHSEKASRRSAEASQRSARPTRLWILEPATAAVRPGLLTARPALATDSHRPGRHADHASRQADHASRHPRHGSRHPRHGSRHPRLGSRHPRHGSRSQIYRFADAQDPESRTDYQLGPSGLPRRLGIQGAGLPLRLRLTSRARAEAALTRHRPAAAAALTLDLHARLPAPLALRHLRWALTLPGPLSEAQRAALDGPYQRQLPGGSATAFTLQTRRPEALPPAVLTQPYPRAPDAAPLPAEARRYLHPRLPPRLAPRSPLRAAVARELADARTALDAALRLTRWAARAAPRHPDAPRGAAHGPAALLVAALRAAGLPARLAYGLLYAGSLATEHRWVEVYLGPPPAAPAPALHRKTNPNPPGPTRPPSRAAAPPRTGHWIPLDPAAEGIASAAHLRLAVSPPGPLPSPAARPSQGRTRSAPSAGVLIRDPAADWRLLRRRLRGLRARLLEALLPSGLRFVPGGRLNAQVTQNVLQHRVWGFVARRPPPPGPPATRFVLPGPRDDFELQIVATTADLRLTLRLYAANAEGLDARAFLARGYRPRTIGSQTYLVKTRQTDTAASHRTNPSQPPNAPGSSPSGSNQAGSNPAGSNPAGSNPSGSNQAGSNPSGSNPSGSNPSTPTGKTRTKPDPNPSASLRRTYVQFTCTPEPWAARLVRWTLEARGAGPRFASQLATLEQKTLGTFQMPGHPTTAGSCPAANPRPSRAKPKPDARPTPSKPARPRQRPRQLPSRPNPRPRQRPGQRPNPRTNPRPRQRPRQRPNPRPRQRPNPRPRQRTNPRPRQRTNPRPRQRTNPRPRQRTNPRPRQRPRLSSNPRTNPRPRPRAQTESQPRAPSHQGSGSAASTPPSPPVPRSRRPPGPPRR
jgi:hypothetical protein